MKPLIIQQKTGFRNLTPFEILDKNGVLFYANYFTQKGSNGSINFNLPIGQYYLHGDLMKLKHPVSFGEIKLPKPQRNFKQKKYKITFANNPNKCTIFHDTGLIVFDNFFKNAPRFILLDIYFHELGHNFYKSEQYADMYATKKMLEIGYNPSQIGLSVLITLRETQNNDFRKLVKLNTLKNAEL